VIYLDTSVALAQLLAEDRCPPAELWERELVTSRLFEYELWNAIHRRRLEKSHGDAARRVVESLAIAELSREVVRRATERFPSPVRTLDALHLATMLFLRDQGLDLQLASYDQRLTGAAEALDIPLVDC
jgi:predicted nucleic acid-binding protein